MRADTEDTGRDLACRTCTIKGLLCIYRLLSFGEVHVSYGVKWSIGWMTVIPGIVWWDYNPSLFAAAPSAHYRSRRGLLHK